MKIWLVFLILSVFSLKALAQGPDTLALKSKKDSVNRVRDSITSRPFKPKVSTSKVYRPDTTHSAHKAFIRSLIIPGWGHVYNHQWYLAPIYYGALGTLAGIYIYNAHWYSIAKKEGDIRKFGGTSTGPYASYGGSYTVFYDAAAYNQRNEQLCIFGFAAVWAIDAIHAYINGKFIHSYTMDNNLSFKLTPEIMNQPVYASNFSVIPGIKLTFTLK